MSRLFASDDQNTYFSYLMSNIQRTQWHPTPVLLPRKPHGRRSLVGYSPWDREELDTTGQLQFHFSLFTFIHWRRKWQPTPVFLPGESQGQGEPGGLPSLGLHRVGHDWSKLAAAAACLILFLVKLAFSRFIKQEELIYASGPFPLLFTVPETLFSQLSTWMFLPHLSDLNLPPQRVLPWPCYLK